MAVSSPSIRPISRPLLRSHRRVLLSELHESTVRLSGETAAQDTISVWPFKRRASLETSCRSLLSDSSVSVIVIASAVDGYFSTGADIGAFRENGAEQMPQWVSLTHRLAKTVRDADKPVLHGDIDIVENLGYGRKAPQRGDGISH